jgi:hypothetical protein
VQSIADRSRALPISPASPFSDTFPFDRRSAMLDRVIGILGLALALIFGLLPLTDFKVPLWLIYAGVIVGVLLIGIAIGLLIGADRETVDTTTVPQLVETNLFLQFSDSHSVPIEKNPRNIKAWYALYTESVYVDAKDKDGNSLGGFGVPPRWSVFVLFEKPPIFRQMIATCIGPNQPKCELRTANTTYAVVTMLGDVTGSTFELSIIR